MKRSTDAVRRVPERTCVACRKVLPKRDLVRIVRIPDGGIAVDETGKRSGRGAYLCRARKCWDQGLKGKRLEGMLHTELAPEDRRKLEEYRDTL